MRLQLNLFFGTDSIYTAIIYFALVFLFVLNRSNVLQILGKYLTPLIVIILSAVICIGIFSPPGSIRPSAIENPLIGGLLEGYQTYDALAGILMGGVVIISLNIKGYKSYEQKRKLIAGSGLIAAFGLFIMYAGLIALGSHYNNQFDLDITRTELLNGLSQATLGNIGRTFLGVLVSLACFTTAVSIIVGTADFFKGLFNESKTVYKITGLIACILGVLMGQMDVHYIIEVAIPALMFIYPLTIVLILLNILPEHWRSKLVFRAVVIVTFIFSIPDFLGALLKNGELDGIKEILPLAKDNLTWALPALLTFLLFNYRNLIGQKTT